MVKYRDIPGFPGYRVGDDGTVWSCRPANGQGDFSDKWRQLSPAKKRSNRLMVILMRDGIKHYKQVHRLVLEAFVGPCPEGLQARHLDDIQSNNRLKNLAWGTSKENAEDKIKNERSSSCEDHWAAQIDNDTAILIYFDCRSGQRVDVVAAKYGVSEDVVRRIRSKKTWKRILPSHPLADHYAIKPPRKKMVMTEEHKKKIAEANRKRTGCHHSEEAKRKLSEFAKKRFASKRERKRIGIARRKWTHSDVVRIRRLYERGIGFNEIARRVGLSASTVARICGKTY